MQKPGRLNITMYQGATFNYRLTWNLNGSPVDLTGYTARLQVRRSHRAPTALLSLTTETGGITLGDAAGTIDLVASATVSAGVLAGDHVYDLELVDAGGVVVRFAEGAWIVDPEVTR